MFFFLIYLENYVYPIEHVLNPVRQGMAGVLSLSQNRRRTQHGSGLFPLDTA